MIRVALTASKRMFRVWPQLVAADLATRVAATLLITPVVALVVRAALARAGGGALTDQDILRFVLSPGGLGVALFVGAASALAGLVGHAAIMTVLAGDEEGLSASWMDGMRYAARRFVPIFETAFRGLIRLLVPAVPFLLVAAGAYLLLLREFDINYYLTARPPSFWLAGGLISVSLLGMAWFAGGRLLRWSVALPRLLFGGVSPSGALGESREVTEGRLGRVVVLLGLWAGATVLVSMTVTGAAAFLGRSLVPEGGTNLAVISSAIAVAVGLGALGNLVVSVASSVSLAAFLFELDRLWSSGWVLPDEVTAAPGTAEKSTAPRIPRWAWAVAAVAVPAGVLGLGLQLVGAAGVQSIPEVTAHRGASGRAPENTLAAIRAAIADGAQWVEIDVQETSDGVVVVHHDEDFMRAAGDARKIWEAPWSEVAQIPYGGWFGPEYEDERVATLEEALRMARGRIRVNIELKVYGQGQRLEERTVEIVEALGMEDQVALMSLHRPTVETLNRLRPEWRVGLLAAVSIGDLSRLEADFLAVNARTATPGFVRRAQQAGKDVLVWTVNHPAQMAAVVSSGADGIITDEPALAQRVLAQLESLTPIQRLMLSAAARFGVIPGASAFSEAAEA